MSRKDERRLVACEQCERTYPGFENEAGELHAVGGPTCSNCGSSSFVAVEFAPSLTLSCPNCGTEHRETVEVADEVIDVTATRRDPDDVVRVTCSECDEEFDVGYETVD